MSLSIFRTMPRPTPDNRPAPSSRVPRGGWLAIGFILAAMALLSFYSNVQNARRDHIEKVTITPAAPTTPPPAVTEP